MAKTEDYTDRREGGGGIAKLIKCALAGTGLLFFTGVGLGVTMVVVERGEAKPLALAIGAAALVLAALCGWALYRLKPFAMNEDGPVSPRVLNARRTLGLSAVVGAVLGVVLSIATLSSDDPWGLFGDAPLPPWVAALAIAVWIGVVPLLSWRWWRNIDEHEAAAYRFGAVAGMYGYAFIMPTWWMGWRGGFLPEPQAMLIFVVVIVVWGAAWLSRRSA